MHFVLETAISSLLCDIVWSDIVLKLAAFILIVCKNIYSGLKWQKVGSVCKALLYIYKKQEVHQLRDFPLFEVVIDTLHELSAFDVKHESFHTVFRILLLLQALNLICNIIYQYKIHS